MRFRGAVNKKQIAMLLLSLGTRRPLFHFIKSWPGPTSRSAAPSPFKGGAYTHPPLMERIEAAQQEAVERGEDGKRE